MCNNLSQLITIKQDKKSAGKEVKVGQVSMIAGGTGITPMLQLVRAVFRDPEVNWFKNEPR